MKLSTFTKSFPGFVLDSWSLEINEEAWHVAELNLCLYDYLKCILSTSIWSHMTSGDVYMVFEPLFPDMSNITYHTFRQMRWIWKLHSAVFRTLKESHVNLLLHKELSNYLRM